jgi:hypothetical protein
VTGAMMTILIEWHLIVIVNDVALLELAFEDFIGAMEVILPIDNIKFSTHDIFLIIMNA